MNNCERIWRPKECLHIFGAVCSHRQLSSAPTSRSPLYTILQSIPTINPRRPHPNGTKTLRHHLPHLDCVRQQPSLLLVGCTGLCWTLAANLRACRTSLLARLQIDHRRSFSTFDAAFRSTCCAVHVRPPRFECGLRPIKAVVYWVSYRLQGRGLFT